MTCPSVPATAEAEVSATAALAPSTPPPTTISDHRDHKAARLRRFSQLIRRVRLRGGKGSRVQKRNKRKKEKNAARKERKATKTLAIVLGNFTSLICIHTPPLRWWPNEYLKGMCLPNDDGKSFFSFSQYSFTLRLLPTFCTYRLVLRKVQ